MLFRDLRWPIWCLTPLFLLVELQFYLGLGEESGLAKFYLYLVKKLSIFWALFQLRVDMLHSSGQWHRNRRPSTFFDVATLRFLAARFLPLLALIAATLPTKWENKNFLWWVCVSVPACFFGSQMSWSQLCSELQIVPQLRPFSVPCLLAFLVSNTYSLSLGLVFQIEM